MRELGFKSNIRDYVVQFESAENYLNSIEDESEFIFVIDKNVFDKHKERLNLARFKKLLLLDAIEENKNLEYCSKVFDFFTEHSVKRTHTLVSIGGGITQDLTGFVASTYYRGIQWTFFPTTLLAQTDSCVGSKTSLNFKKFKNLLGSFYPPGKIIIDTEFVNTLSRLDFFSGIGECVKFQLMQDEAGVSDLDSIIKKIDEAVDDSNKLSELIFENLKIKNSFIEGDEFDLGRRNFLNYGHCLGHALETTSNYRVPHGIAVNLGIAFANLASRNRGFLSDGACSIIFKNLIIKNVPLEMQISEWNHDQILECMKKDKKRVGKDLTIVIPDAELQLKKITDFSFEEFAQTLDDTKRLLFS